MTTLPTYLVPCSALVSLSANISDFLPWLYIRKKKGRKNIMTDRCGYGFLEFAKVILVADNLKIAKHMLPTINA